MPLEREFEDYKAAADQRHNNLDNMSKIVGRLMNKGNQDQEIQTDEVLFKDDKSESSVEIDPASQTFNVETSPNTPANNPNHYYHLPLNNRQGANEPKYRDYHMRLNTLISEHKRRRTNEDGLSTGEGRHVWATSNIMIMFLENTIK